MKGATSCGKLVGGGVSLRWGDSPDIVSTNLGSIGDDTVGLGVSMGGGLNWDAGHGQ